MSTATKKQNVVATSETAKQFITDESASHSAPNKGGDVTTASNRETVDAMVNFIEATRYVKREVPSMVEGIDSEGNACQVPTGEMEEIEVDSFAEAVQAVLAERLDTVRVNSAAAKLATAEAQLAELRAQLAALTGA